MDFGRPMISSIACIIFWQAEHLSSLTFRHLSTDHLSLLEKGDTRLHTTYWTGSAEAAETTEKFGADPFCDLQEMWNKVTYTWGACGSPLPTSLGCDSAVIEFGLNTDNEVLVRKTEYTSPRSSK